MLRCRLIGIKLYRGGASAQSHVQVSHANGPSRDDRNRKETAVRTAIYEDHGVRFEYPSDWTVEVDDEGAVKTVDLQHPGGVAFALVRTDELCTDPAELSDQALEAMREEYPELDAAPAMETLSAHRATGHDIEFFSLDTANGACIRSFRTPRRTVLIFGQWSDLGGEDLSELVRGVFRTLEELEN
jgi:hypothetical protein